MKDAPPNELRRLIDGMLDGTLDEAGLARLEEMMRDDEAAMDHYLAAAAQDGLMAQALLTNEAPVVKRGPAGAWWIGIAAAAAVVIAVLAFHRSGPPNRGAGALASVTDVVGVVWNGDPFPNGAPLGGMVDIRSGLLEITHDSGTRLLLEGPAAYEVTGPNAGRLVHGKLVAEVPPGAEGFTVDCPDGQVVDYGTEFAIEADPDKGTMEVGVFRGEVKVKPNTDAGGAVPLYTGHAVRVPGMVESPLRSIPFDQSRFIRQAPSREMPWYFSGDSRPMEWDVSHLVWSAGEHIVVLKWMSGPDALVLQKMDLLLDGEVVATDEHPCSVGDLGSTLANVYQLPVPEGSWRRGNWTLRAWPGAMDDGATSEGILMLEDATALDAEAADFVGVWEYVHDGVIYRRTFRPDGTCLLEFNGQPTPYFESARWSVRDGILEVNFDASEIVERHLLRDHDSLVFINQPYRNARRVE
ncbi:MAG: FecR domain-containing protein [Akkermansiaceae bacterium]|nr:FecR domain-containing protein [Akkermansiaceae bacterium]MCP5544300.1 FecR domain-containing protein [Akkermansiaceae bacterium]MCP5546976.1 FecR domain-containing protein [Akkermansiaceae bacterium]